MRVRVYLRQALFSLPGAAGHIPASAAVIDGALIEVNSFGLGVAVDQWMDEKGRSLEGAPRQLLIPSSKIDHVSYLS